jgi:hypothetical protein
MGALLQFPAANKRGRRKTDGLSNGEWSIEQHADADLTNVARFGPKPKSPSIGVTRTPELAFILGIMDALPDDVRRLALCRVMQIGERAPSCEASQAAANLAAMIALAKGH